MNNEDIKLDSIEEAIEEFKAGKFVVVVDDEDRENEGDLIMAAEKVTPEAVNFMISNARLLPIRHPWHPTSGAPDTCIRSMLRMRVCCGAQVTPRPEWIWPGWQDFSRPLHL